MVNKLAIVNLFDLHAFHRNITHLAIITPNLQDKGKCKSAHTTACKSWQSPDCSDCSLIGLKYFL